MQQRIERWLLTQHGEDAPPHGAPEEMVAALTETFCRLEDEGLDDAEASRQFVDALVLLGHPAVRMQLSSVITLAWRIALLPMTFPGPRLVLPRPQPGRSASVHGRWGARLVGEDGCVSALSVVGAPVALETAETVLPYVSASGGGAFPTNWRDLPVGSVVRVGACDPAWGRIEQVHLADEPGMGGGL